MATKVIKIFTALSIVFYVLLVFYMIFAIYTIRKSEFESSLELSTFINSVVDSSYSVENSISTEYFGEKISDVFESNPKIAGLLLFSDNRGLEFIRLRSTEYLGSSTAPDFSAGEAAPEITPVHPFIKISETTLYLNDGKSFRSIIIFDLLDRSRFFPVLRNTLIGAVFYLILAIIYLSIYSSSKPKSSEPSGEVVSYNESADEPSFEPGNEIVPETIPEISEEPVPGTTGGSGMYSDRSGLVWEHFLPEKLDAELKRAASFDQDSCLVFLTIFSPSGFIPYRNISELIVEHFKYKDLAFESGENRFCIIIPEKDIDEGQVDVEKFKNNLLKRFPDSSYKIYAGITSRNSRLLSENRMIMEAKSALKKAEEEPDSTTIVFRTDLNKYREYIASTI